MSVVAREHHRIAVVVVTRIVVVTVIIVAVVAVVVPVTVTIECRHERCAGRQRGADLGAA